MIISKIVKAKWNGKNKKHFVEKGYKYTKLGYEFDIKVEDLMPRSRFVVEVMCDYCGKIHSMEYYKVINKRVDSITGKDCCSACSPKKVAEGVLEKYGVKHPAQLSEVKEKRKQTCFEKYGVEYASQSEQSKQKRIKTCMERYGVESHTQTQEYKDKVSKENSPHWKGGTITGRSERNLLEYRYWRKNVFSKFNYTCQCCGKKSGKEESIILNAHHIENWKDNVSKRYDVDNGIALCEKCHIEFHSDYGKRNNTQEQLFEFLNGYGKDIC